MLVYTLPHIIENAARQQPGKIAFKYLSGTITFLELHTKSDQLAHYLIGQGIQKGDRIGIYMARCLETTIAIYGILKAGAVYVPLDPFAPVTRTEFVIKDCGIQHLISTSQQTRKLKKFSEDTGIVSVIGMHQKLPYATTISWDIIFHTSLDHILQANILGDDLAYILYTSGSTGIPKGIMHTHASALAFVQLAATMYDMKDAIYGMHAPLHFDPSVQGYFGAPYALATTIIVSDAHTKMPTSLTELIEKEKITIWFSVPLALIQMLSHGNLDKRDMSSLKWVLFSGEVFATKHLQTLMRRWPFARFSNIYGPTETNQCTYYHLDTPPVGDASIPIGYAWGNTAFKIIDAQDQEVTKGAIGELVVRTATMMKGYWNNPIGTQKSFYKDEIIKEAPHIYYRTGDQVQEDEEGRLLFLGRKDHQVKVRGYRIELGEIENVFTSYPGIEETIAMVTSQDDTTQKTLISVIVPSQQSSIDLEALKEFCQKKLPVYAIPDTIHILERFPRTASGKINRKEIEILITP